MERQLPASEPREDLSITEPKTNGAPDPLPERKHVDFSSYWLNPDGSFREPILQKARQILRGQY